VIGAITLINMAGHFAIEALVLLAAAAASPAIAGAQGLVRASPARSQLCRQPAGYTAPVLAAVRSYVTGPDPKTARLRAGLLQDSSESVYVVTDETICRRGAVAIALEKGRSDTINVYPVLTIKAGRLRYVLDDGNTLGGEFEGRLVADTSFHILGAIAN